jgi:hypothetical protein
MIISKFWGSIILLVAVLCRIFPVNRNKVQQGKRKKKAARAQQIQFAQ